MVWVVESAPLPLVQMMGAVQHAGVVGIAQTCLATSRTRHPAEEVIEGPVLHQQHHDVIETAVLRIRQPMVGSPGRRHG